MKPDQYPTRLQSSDYCSVLDRLYGLTRFGEKYDLSTPRELEKRLGSPLSRFPSILIAGTNGKGSTCAFLETVLRQQGLKTGLFTSPHLVSFTERIRIDGQPMEAQWIADNGDAIVEMAESLGASFFEAAWALAMVAFEAFSVDIAIWEVGLGGRLDATNVADPIVSAIVSIDLDHTHILGDTLVDIAREKAAVYRPGRPALTSAIGPGLAALRSVGPPHMRSVGVLSDLPRLPLPGDHQRRNASLACAVAQAAGYSIDPQHLSQTQWPARGERFGQLILDCAHNPAAIQILGDWVRAQHQVPIHVIFGAMEGKDVGPMVKSLEQWADSATLVTPNYPRRRAAAELVQYFERLNPSVMDDVRHAVDNRPNTGLTVVCGSGFLAGEVRAHLTGISFPECGIVTTAR